jgi:hypothetical protein
MSHVVNVIINGHGTSYLDVVNYRGNVDLTERCQIRGCRSKMYNILVGVVDGKTHRVCSVHYTYMKTTGKTPEEMEWKQ